MELDEEVVFGEIFPASRVTNIRKEICGVRSMIDATSGGALVDKTPEATRNLIANMAANSQQFGTKLNPPSKHVNEVICKWQRLVGFVRGKEVEIPVKAAPASLKQEREQNVIADKNVPNDDEVRKHKFPPLSDYKPVPPFPQGLVESRKYEQNKDYIRLFVDARKQKLKGCEKVRVGENVSAVIQRKLPAKRKDIGMFTIPCTIGNTQLEKAMLDLGASINVMPYSVYVSLKLRPLNKTGFVIQLADRSIAYPKGVVEDVLVQVNDLVFLADFYVLDMENGDQTTPILLGRPFLKTSKTTIDVHSVTLTMEFEGEIVKSLKM
ncbi:uncharacterized protein LOC115985432 [Quercus lobata]|uniref:uncharacterized protein LOC115985432 n=1 Tax=Quercus lobata TaxID=97700 RepID=UPI001247C825|nr:uncharacterized protein LOC115985432 [Quercus lobata]